VRTFLPFRTIAALLLASASLSIAAEQPEVEVSPANKLYQQAVIEAERASKLERRGKKEAAIGAYELGGQLAEASIAEAERTGVAEEDRPLDAYFLCATSYLHAGRLINSMKEGEEDRKEGNLRKATIYLEQVEKLESLHARRKNAPVNPEIWRVRNAIAYACFLRGDLAQARLQYGAVLELNPSYRPAEEAIAEINKLEQRENELFTPQGRTLDKEKRRKALKEVVSTLRLVRDIVTLGR
jgi:tetratricopeptide (TPR) repeat protein